LPGNTAIALVEVCESGSPFINLIDDTEKATPLVQSQL